ncbi:MAG: hypothetical protein H5T24_09910 [Bacteroidales bacterium]|nr:hypothetical protein [Bacteroidales bacterium]
MGAPWVELPRDTIRHAYGVTHVVSLTKTHHHVPPPTHCRVWLLCLYLLLQLHSHLKGNGWVRLFSTFNLDDPSKSPLRGETLVLQ